MSHKETFVKVSFSVTHRRVCTYIKRKANNNNRDQHLVVRCLTIASLTENVEFQLLDHRDQKSDTNQNLESLYLTTKDELADL